ncbi:uncharacterized protein PHALS_02097 [Plasmopara halstedii]|uniref:Uncharacterized protein n=1 Tax=Plasmopara halstedii TaxID=4781 RepID=A0A0P1AYJ5_PLAHL|nr:uncharacterized protein PHALS_02097 [Plasmopara halstedii]CEG45825.1 hypothetical protein PHALS_02097 [Plasmopara halstedii]|eukprot:XP_024582194.1 hypothetical protein PHALS_02097 [Plasmopara halstedii]
MLRGGMTKAQRLLNAITSDLLETPPLRAGFKAHIAENANMLLWLLLVFVDLYRTRRGLVKLNVRYSKRKMT